MQPGETLPPQHQDRQPGLEAEMHPKPQSDSPQAGKAGKLNGKVALQVLHPNGGTIVNG